jgi:hypothetical protein
LAAAGATFLEIYLAAFRFSAKVASTLARVLVVKPPEPLARDPSLRVPATEDGDIDLWSLDVAKARLLSAFPGLRVAATEASEYGAFPGLRVAATAEGAFPGFRVEATE